MGGHQYSEEAVSKAHNALSTLTLIIKGVNVEEAKQLAAVLRDMAKKDPTRDYLFVVQGLGDKSPEEYKRTLQQIFPPPGVGA